MPDIYRIGVAISLTNNVSAALKVIQRDILGLGHQVDLTQGKFDRLKLAVVGAGAALAGVGMLKGFQALASAGGQLLDQQQKILAAGTTQADLAKEMAAAYQMAAISGSNLAQNLKLVADLRSVFGYKNLAEAISVAPAMLKAGIAAGNLTGIDPEQAAYNIALIEDRLGYTLNRKTGQLDAGRATTMANLIDAIISGTNGRVDTQQLLGFAQQALNAGKLLSTQGLINLVPLIQAMGGQRAGTALTAYNKAIVGGVMTTRGTTWLESLGLLDPRSVHKGGSGYARLDPNAIAGSSISAVDPQTWVNTYLLPALQKAVGPNGGLPDMLKLLAQSGLANTTVRFLSELVGSSVQNAKDVQNIQKAAGSNQYAQTMQGLSGAVSNFATALDSLWQALGLPAAKMGVTILNDLSSGIRNFTQWVGAHPGYADAIDKLLLGLGAALTVLGAAAVATALVGMVGAGGTIALAAGGLATLATAIALLPNAINGLNAAFSSLLNVLGLSDPSHPNKYNRDLPPSLRNLAVPGATSVEPPTSGSQRYGRHVPGQLGMADIPADNAVIADWIRAGSPMTVTNTGDIARGANAYGQKQLQKPNTGASGVNLRATPSGSAALAIPGFA